MDALGFFLFVLALAAIFRPREVGKWLGEIKRGMEDKDDD